MIPCPHCGEPISERATSCRHCGSDAETGWHEDVDYYSVDLPEDDEPASSSGAGPGKSIIAWVCVFGVMLFVFRGNWRIAVVIAIGLGVFLGLRALSPRQPVDSYRD